MDLHLAPRSDVERLAIGFRETGALSAAQFLVGPDADRLTAELEAFCDWVEIFRAGDRVYEMPHAAFAELDIAQRVTLREKIEDEARRGLQYRYRAVRVSDRAEQRSERRLLVDRFADLMNAPASLEMMRTITGRENIVFVDAQATDYRSGDFLTTHDDVVEGKHRVAAYVFSLTRRWQADWGGLLMFEEGERVSGFVPDYNVLRLFAVPRRHHVSLVAPWVDERRLSITGWLRTAMPED